MAQTWPCHAGSQRRMTLALSLNEGAHVVRARGFDEVILVALKLWQVGSEPV